MSEEKTILVVDDEPRYLRLVEVNLVTDGYAVQTAMDGQQAVEAVAGDQPDLILLDVMMPVMDGFTACERIREFSSVPIIIVTAKGEERDRVRAWMRAPMITSSSRSPLRNYLLVFVLYCAAQNVKQWTVFMSQYSNTMSCRSTSRVLMSL